MTLFFSTASHNRAKGVFLLLYLHKPRYFFNLDVSCSATLVAILPFCSFKSQSEWQHRKLWLLSWLGATSRPFASITIASLNSLPDTWERGLVFLCHPIASCNSMACLKYVWIFDHVLFDGSCSIGIGRISVCLRIHVHTTILYSLATGLPYAAPHEQPLWEYHDKLYTFCDSQTKLSLTSSTNIHDRSIDSNLLAQDYWGTLEKVSKAT